MKNIIPILLFIILPITLKAQKEYTQMIDSIFQHVSRVDATTGIFCAPSSEEEKKIQAPYKHSIGGMVHAIAAGPSYKTFFAKNFAFQTDIFIKALFTGGVTKERYEEVLYFLLETSTNFMYQKKIKDYRKYELFWFMGGGVSFGYEFHGYGKFGTNAMIGLELCSKKIPLTFQMDLRPGYAMLFDIDGNPIEIPRFFWHRYKHKNPWSHFDWIIGFTLRYAIKNNVK